MIFYIDSGKLPESTQKLIKRYQKLGFQFQVFRPNEELLQKELPKASSCNRSKKIGNKCHYLRIEEPRQRALHFAEGWVSAQRVSEDGLPRKVRIASEHRGILKINPLSGWKSEEIWAYVKEKEIPYNPMHEQAFIRLPAVPVRNSRCGN